MRPGATIAILIVLVPLSCTFHYGGYVPVLREPMKGRSVSLRIINEDVQLRLDQGLGAPQPYHGGSVPGVAKYTKDALEREFQAGGFSVVDDMGDFDVAVDLRITETLLANALPVYLLLIAYAKSAAVVQVTVYVELTASGRTFRRSFAGVEVDGYVMLLGIPVGYQQDQTTMLKASQQCFSQLVTAVGELLERVAREEGDV